MSQLRRSPGPGRARGGTDMPCRRAPRGESTAGSSSRTRCDAERLTMTARATGAHVRGEADQELVVIIAVLAARTSRDLDRHVVHLCESVEQTEHHRSQSRPVRPVLEAKPVVAHLLADERRWAQ